MKYAPIDDQGYFHCRVFMRTGMREIPNAYGAPPARLISRERE